MVDKNRFEPEWNSFGIFQVENGILWERTTMKAGSI